MRQRLTAALSLAALAASAVLALAPPAFADAGQGNYRALSSPKRILDMRVGTGARKAPVAAGATVALQVLGIGIPSSGVSAVALMSR